MSRCHFEAQGPCAFRADGQPDRAHWIPAQRLRKEGVEGEAIWDHRIWVHACRKHHDRLDGRDALNPLSVRRSQLPDGVEDYASEHGLEWSLATDYPE